MVRRKKSLDEDLQRDLTGKEVKELLRRAHLPSDYAKLTPRDQRKARKAVLTSWFEVDKPHILCTNPENYVAAHFLWVEFYRKPEPINHGVYYFDDPLNKYDLVASMIAPARVPTEPSKGVIVATRRMGKTQTVVIEGMEMMAIVRPFTLCLLSELNDTRTGEEVQKIQSQIEDNNRIHSDFGAEGVLFPKSRTQGTWNKHHLKFLHYPGCAIMGHSLGAAQRGRGPIFGVIDDPEDEDNTFNMEFRKWFFSKLLHVYVNMFHFGGILRWIGTPVHEGSCLSLAMKGMVELEDDEKPIVDKRFTDWHRGKFPLIKKGEDGNFISMQPQRISVEAFHRKLEIDPISAQKEILCEPVTPGTRAFHFDPTRHGFVVCKAEDGGTYVLDLYTGMETPWNNFLRDLLVLGAGDLADGQSAEADPGALVFVGVDPTGVIYVLDCWEGRVFVEKQVRKAYELAMPLDCTIFGWEKAALQVAINRVVAKREVAEMRERGMAAPIFREVENMRKNKVRRILTMTPLFGKNQIRFRVFDKIEGADGKVHTPAEYGREGSYRTLLAQTQEYTDEGIHGHDDLLDALEMAVRLSNHRRGEITEDLSGNQSDVVRGKWKKAGLDLGPQALPPDRWTEKMREEMEPAPQPDAVLGGVIPYV